MLKILPQISTRHLRSVRIQGIHSQDQVVLKEQQTSSKVRLRSAAQSCPTLCDPMDCSPPGSSFHGVLQASILEWVAISSSRGSSQPRD